jgi:hypothetical protein
VHFLAFAADGADGAAAVPLITPLTVNSRTIESDAPSGFAGHVTIGVPFHPVNALTVPSSSEVTRLLVPSVPGLATTTPNVFHLS